MLYTSFFDALDCCVAFAKNTMLLLAPRLLKYYTVGTAVMGSASLSEMRRLQLRREGVKRRRLVQGMCVQQYRPDSKK